MRKLGFLILVAAACGSSSDEGDCITFSQWGRDSSHSGAVCTAGQDTSRVLAKLFYDPHIMLETGDADGDLLVHYQAPLIVDDDVYMMFKAGVYTHCDRSTTSCDLYYRNSQIWTEKGLRWEGGQLVDKWTFESDWKPAPWPSFEPMFQPAIGGDFIYVPGAGGTLHKVDRATGVVQQRIQPFGATIDPDTYVAGAITVDKDGNVLYTAVKLDHANPFDGPADATGWLVKVTPDDATTIKTFAEMIPGAPATCHAAFNVRDFPRPWPPADVDGQPVLPPEIPCLSQRPGINAAPAIGSDGTIFLVSRAHGTDRSSFMIALGPDLGTKWTRALNQALDDGCGKIIPYGTTEQFLCRAGARPGVDPNTNELPAARVNDSSSSSPVALPDGGVLYGSYTSYNGARGHMIRINAAGAIVATHDFGWDTTPAIYEHDGTYSIITKDNTYGVNQDGFDTGPFLIKQLSPSLQLEWAFTATNTQSCVRAEDGQVSCISDHPNGFEWCINAPVVDMNGVVYANSEDGNLYAIGQDGKLKGQLFMEMALGAAYTPLALDGSGRIYTLNDGKLSVIGK